MWDDKYSSKFRMSNCFWGGNFWTRILIFSDVEISLLYTNKSHRISCGVTFRASAILQIYSREGVEEPFSRRFIKLGEI